MGVIKNKSDQNIIDNVNELITPSKVREVNDVIDAQVEAAKTSISTLENNVSTLQTNLSTTNTEVNNLSQTIQNLGSSGVPNGGTTGQILSKNSNTDKDTVWIDAPSGGVSGDFLPTTGGTMTGDIDMQGKNISNLGRIEKNFYDADSYSNRTIFFEPDAENDVFHVSTHLEYNSDQSSKFSARSLVDKGYVDGKVQSYLPLFGGQMSSTAKVFKLGGLEINFEHNTINGINTLRGNTFDLDMSAGYVDNADLKYRADYSANYTARSIPDKGYVDAQKPKKFKQTFGATGADPIEQLVTHNLGTTEVLAIVRSTEGIIDVSYPTLKNVTANSFVFTRAGDAGSTEITVIAFAD